MSGARRRRCRSIFQIQARSVHVHRQTCKPRSLAWLVPEIKFLGHWQRGWACGGCSQKARSLQGRAGLAAAGSLPRRPRRPWAPHAMSSTAGAGGSAGGEGTGPAASACRGSGTAPRHAVACCLRKSKKSVALIAPGLRRGAASYRADSWELEIIKPAKDPAPASSREGLYYQIKHRICLFCFSSNSPFI